MKTVLVTGASKGIGKDIALRFSEAGYGVVINYNSSKEQAKELLEKIKAQGGNAVIIKADVSDEVQVKNMFDEAHAYFRKGIDVLINNAAISLYGLFCDIKPQQYKRLFDVNLFGVINCIRQALPYMISNKSGCIINISSIWGITGASCEAHYSASKAAIIGLTKALAKETGMSGINVNCIAPGVIQTDMIKHLNNEEIEELKQQTPLNRLGSVEDISKLALFLASSDAGYITGQVISPNGGMVI